MPYPHGSACRCPPGAPDDGLLAYTVDCDHYRDLLVALARIAGWAPPPPAAAETPVPSTPTPAVRRAVARQPWEPRPSRHRRAA